MNFKCADCGASNEEYPHRDVLFAKMSGGFVGPCCFDKYDVEIVSEDNRWSGYVPRSEIEMWTKPGSDYRLKV